MADSESDVSMISPSAVTMVSSLNTPPSDVMEAVNQSNAVIPALFALPSEGGNAKKLKLCKRVGWLRDGVFTTGFMEINIKEAKQKGIFNQPRHVTLVQGEDSIFQSQVIQGQKAPSSKQLSSLVLSPGTSTMGIISARGKVIPKRITVVKNVPFAIKSKGKLIALGKAPSFGTLANKAGTSADTATGHQNQTEGSEVAKNFSMVTHGLSTPNVQDSAPGWQMLPHPSSHHKESVLVEDKKVCVKTKQDRAAPAGETQSFPAKKRLRKQKRSPRITRAKMKDGIPPKVTNLGSPLTDICHLKSWSNPKLDLLKMDIDFSRHNVLQMEGLIHLPCDPSPSEFNCLGKKEIPETRRNFSDKVQEAPELYSVLSKGTTNKHLENQTTAQSENRTVENGQYSTECSNQTLVHEEQEQNTDAVEQSEPIQIKKVVRSSDKQEKFQKRKFYEACSPSTNRASSKLKCNLSEELSCGEPAVKYTKVVDPELSGTPPTNLGSKTGLSQHYDPDPFLQNERNRCGQVSLSGNQDIFIQNKRPECVAGYSGDNITTNANTCSLQDVGAKASSQNNKGVTTNCPMSPVQTVGGQASSHAISVNFSTSVNSDLELTEGNHFGNNSRNTLSITTISETNNEQPSLPSDSSVDKTTLDLASDGVPLLQIGSVYSLSAEEAKRLFPKASIETPSEVVETNQSPVDADSNIPISSSTSGSVVEPSATKVNLEPLDLSIDSQPSQSQTSDISICPIQAQTIETVSTTTCTLQTTRLSSSAISNSKVKTTSVQHTTPLPPVVCINGQVLTLDPNKLPGKVQKDPMELVVIAPPNTAHNVGQNVIPKTLHVSHSRMSSIQIEKPPSQQQSKVHATSIIVPLTQTVTVLGPPAFRNPGNKSSSVLNISSVSVQSSFRRTPLFQNGSFVGCNTTSVPTSVMPNAASDVSCSTSAGSVCTSISSSSAVGSICSTDTESVKKPTQHKISTTSNQNTPEAEGQRTFLITTTLGENKLISFPSTANGVHILSQMTQAQDNQVFLNQLQAKKHKERLRNDAIGKQAKKISKPTPILAHGSSDNNTDKAISLNIEIEKNPQSDIGKKHRRKRRGRNKYRTTAKGHKGSQEENTTTSNVTTQSLAKYLQALTHNEDLGNKYNTSKFTRPSSQSDGTPQSRPNLPQPNDNHKKRKRFIPSNFCEKSAGLSFDRNEGSLPETQSNIHKKGMKPAGPLSTSQKGTRPSSQPNVSKRGRPQSATSWKTNRRGTTPLSQPNVRKRGRPPATPLNTNQKSTSPSSQPNVSKRGRPLVTPLNTSKKSIMPSSQPNVRKKGRTPAIHLNPNQKGTAPSSQLNVRKRGRTPATPLNKNKKDTTPSSQPNVSKKRRTPASPLNPNQKGTTPSSQSNIRKKGRPPAVHLNPNQKGTTPSSQSKLSKKGKPPAIQLNTSRKGTTPSSQLNVNKKCRTQAALSNTSSKGALPSPKSAVSRERSTPAIPSNVIGKSCSRSSLADVLQKSHVQATLSSSNKKRSSTSPSPATQSSLKKTDNSTLSLPHVNQTSSMSATSWSVSKNDTTISSLSDVYRESSSPSYIYREDRLMQLKKLMKQKEQDIEDMKKLRQLEVREKLSDPELCDL